MNATTTKTTNENLQHCKEIADRLELIAYGQMYRCIECGELVDCEEYADDAELYEAITSGDVCRCPICGDEATFEQVSMFDWLENALDFDYIVNSDREYKAARIMVAFGGPTIYVDTMTQSVDLYWWNERASYPISAAACYELDEAMSELYSC